uniref:Uncharacterized protein n=1 Tax=Brassica oleracea TaxID=3712 RepID=A0A3P6EPI1_BRAOL|nr:unnamed protein product [Brassica oleracea]
MEFSGLTPCGSTPTAPNWKNQMESTEESQRELGRMGLECNTERYTGGSGSANINNFPGQVVGAQVAHETDLKTVQKGEAGYKV